MDVRYIFQDRNTLWLASSSTIVHFRPEDGRLEQFGANDGIRVGEFSPSAGLTAQDGTLYLGTTEGFVSFYPGRVRENDIPPPVLFTRFLASSQDGTENVFLAQGKEDISLSWRQRDIRISFAALSYSAPEKIRYAYRLEGLDEDWKGLGNQNYVALNRLPAGKYRFRVRITGCKWPPPTTAPFGTTKERKSPSSSALTRCSRISPWSCISFSLPLCSTWQGAGG